MRTARALFATLAVALAGALGAPATAGMPTVPVPDAGSTVRVSTRVDGTQATGYAQPVAEPSISANGRYVVFYTRFQNLLGACGPGTYLRDLLTGRLEMISIPYRGCPPEPEPSGSADSWTSISPDGRYVAFGSYAVNLLSRPMPERSQQTGNHTLQVFLRDRQRGRTVHVSVGIDGRPANASASRPTISDDGRYVAFESTATNLVRGDSGINVDRAPSDVFLRDLHRGTTVRVGPNLRRKGGTGDKFYPSLSGNGRYVAFDGDDEQLARSTDRGGMFNDSVSDHQVYVWDRVTGTTELVSRNDAGYGAESFASLDGYAGSKISRDGRWITYSSDAGNLIREHNFGVSSFADDIYLFDRVAKKTLRATDGLAGEGGNGQSQEPCLSADGRYVSFASAASNLGAVDVTPGYHNGFPHADIYLYDRVNKLTRLVSRSTEGLPADGPSRESCPSDGGTTVVFVSEATTLVEGDTNGVGDVFVSRYPG